MSRWRRGQAVRRSQDTQQNVSVRMRNSSSTGHMQTPQKSPEAPEFIAGTAFHSSADPGFDASPTGKPQKDRARIFAPLRLRLGVGGSTYCSSSMERTGTLPYMAPEQIGRMNRSIDSHSDLYALGPYRCRCFSTTICAPEPTSCTLIAIVGELEAHRATGFDENVHKRRHSFLAYPIPL